MKVALGKYTTEKDLDEQRLRRKEEKKLRAEKRQKEKNKKKDVLLDLLLK